MGRIQMIALATVAGLALTTLVVANIHRLGRESVEAEVNQLNQEAGDEADQASSLFERCIDDGGLFDFATGQCKRR